MAEQIKFSDRLFLVGEKVILDSKVGSPILESRNGTLVIGNQRDEGTENEHLVIIKGNLQVDGTMTTVNTETIALADPFILLNGDLEVTDTPEDAGIEINRGSQPNKKFGWDELDDSWTTYDESLNLGTGDIDADNLVLSGVLSASNSGDHTIGDFVFNQSVMSVSSNQMEIRSPGGISLYPDSDNSDTVVQGGEKIVWLRDGTKLVFEGSVPDDYEVKLQATDITADRDIILPDESGTLALQEWTMEKINALSLVVDGIGPHFSGSYNDLTDTPVLFDGNYSSLSGAPTIPSDLSDFTDSSDLLSTDFTGYATQTYVDAQVANIVDSAPNTLDTLNELSAALNNDSDFANNVTASIANKVSISDLSAVATTGSFNDLSDKPAIPQNTVATEDLETVAFSGLYNDLLLRPALFSGSWEDLTDKPALFGGSYLQLTDKPTLFNGQYSSLVGNPTNISQFNNDIGFTKNNAEANIIPINDNQYNLGSTTNQWSTIYGRTVEATYADLAERYAADASYEPGTVLVFGGEAEVTITSQSTNVGVAGIVSSNPGLTLNSDAGNSDTHPYIALKGRVPCRVVGPVRKGDLLVTSSTPGCAESVNHIDYGHAVLGKSLETNLDMGEKLIEVFVV